MTKPPKVVQVHNPCQRRDECWQLHVAAWAVQGVNLPTYNRGPMLRRALAVETRRAWAAFLARTAEAEV